MRIAAIVGRFLLVVGVVSASAGLGMATAPSGVASATNGYGPGLGTEAPGTHWGGAYVLQGVPRYGDCIDAGAADPAERPTTTRTPVPWSISLTLNPASRSTFDTGQQYSGTIVVTSADGNGVGGLTLSAPATASAPLCAAGRHCTGDLTTAATPAGEGVALPEVPFPALAYTGDPSLWLAGAGIGVAVTGALTTLVSRRRRRRRRGSVG
jgi:hypothetical protein